MSIGTVFTVAVVVIGLVVGLWSVFVQKRAMHLFSDRPMSLNRARVIIIIITLMVALAIALGVINN
jgi:hypothetical protein